MEPERGPIDLGDRDLLIRRYQNNGMRPSHLSSCGLRSWGPLKPVAGTSIARQTMARLGKHLNREPRLLPLVSYKFDQTLVLQKMRDTLSRLVSIDHVFIQPAPGQQEKERSNSIDNRHDDHRGLQALGIDHATHFLQTGA